MENRNAIWIAAALLTACTFPLASLLLHTSSINQQPTSSTSKVCQADQSANQSQILYVTESERGWSSGFGCGGFGMSLDSSKVRAEGEKLMAAGKYKDAITLFKNKLIASPYDAQLRLELGKAYAGAGEDALAVFELGPLRTEYAQYIRSVKAANDQSEPKSLFGYTDFSSFMGLSDSVCLSVDYDARKTLEAVTVDGLSKGFWKSVQPLDPTRSRDWHYRVLVASLALGRYAHLNANTADEASAYQLANEQALNLPPSLISNCLTRGTAGERWDQFARAALNTHCSEEIEFFYKRMQAESHRLPETDRRFAAAVHAIASHSLDKLERAELFNLAADAAHKATAVDSRYVANCEFDAGLAFYRLGSFEQARDCLKEAVSLYGKSNLILEASRSHYALGMTEYCLKHSAAAKAQFEIADRLQNQGGTLFLSFAAHNRAVLAIDDAVDASDEQFMVRHAESDSYSVSMAQAGVYFYKLNRFEKAEEYLKKAAEVCFPTCEVQAPTLTGATNGTIGPEVYRDQHFTDDQILAEFFRAGDQMNDQVCSRYSRDSSAIQITEGRRISKAFNDDYSDVVKDLYRSVLVKHKKISELAQFEKRVARVKNQKVQSLVRPESSVNEYLKVVQTRFLETWFPAMHSSFLQSSLRITIDDQGKIEHIRLDKPSGNAVFDQGVMESASWAVSLLPPPPVGWHAAEVSVVFNGDESSKTWFEYSMGQIPMAVPSNEYY